MNYTLIILGIILILVLYVLYRFMSDRQTMVSSKVYLGDTPADVKFDTLANPSSSRYSYNLWIYANAVDSSGNTIFSIGTPKVELKIDTNGNLICDLTDSSGTNSITITPNYPMQRWVCVSISVDSSVVDIYLDGKLVKSQTMTGITHPTESSIITFGTGDIYIAEFERLATPIDPQTAWDRYMAGNGGSYISNMFSSYGATMILSKDQVDMKKFTLF